MTCPGKCGSGEARSDAVSRADVGSLAAADLALQEGLPAEGAVPGVLPVVPPALSASTGT